MAELIDIMRLPVLVPWLLGMVFGIFVGATPGLTATMAVALILPISYHLDPTAGLAMIIGVSFTAIFAGDIPATFLRIPGTPASAAATLDGHAMCRQGRGRFALTLDLICSSLGGMFGVGLLVIIAPLLARFALKFSFYENFWLGVIGLSIAALVTQGSTLKGILSAILGMLIATVGIDTLSARNRFTFGSSELQAGIDFIPAMIGLFGMAEVFRNLRESHSLTQSGLKQERPVRWGETLAALRANAHVLLSSAGLGTFIGALPGAGADIAAWGAYGVARQTSRQKRQFGTGVVAGVIAPTSANNAAVAGAWIPALVFGIPGDAVTAIVLGAMLMYDITPGPALFESVEGQGQLRSLFIVAFVTQWLLIPAGMVGIYTFSLLLRMPRHVVLTAVVVFSVVGSYALDNSLFDVWVMLAFGVAGYFLESRRVPLAPLILGLILGETVIEKNLRQGLISSDGDFTPFVTRPVCTILVGLLVFALAGAPIMKWLTRPRGGP